MRPTYLLTIHESSNRIGNQPLIQILSMSGIFPDSSTWKSIWFERLKWRRTYYLFQEYYTWWAEKSSLWPAMNWAHFLINLIASILVSGKAALHANSERHLIASWKMKDQFSLNAWADKKDLERVHHGCKLGFKNLCDNFTRCLRRKKLRLLSKNDFKNLKSELNNILILVRCCYVKDREDISPSRLDIVPLQKQQGCQGSQISRIFLTYSN